MAIKFDWKPLTDREAMDDAIRHVLMEGMVQTTAIPPQTLARDQIRCRVKHRPSDDTYYWDFEDPDKCDMMADGAIDLNDVDGMI